MPDASERAAARPRRGVYPGSFNPPTIAHLAISEAAVARHRLDELVWVVSERALGKDDVTRPSLAERLEVLQAVAARVDFLRVEVTSDRLLADIADGYDVVVMGADKWHQIRELRWYVSDDDRRRQLARLPTVAVAPRAGHDVPAALRLPVDEAMLAVSSTAARAGDRTVMLPEAIDARLW